MTPEQLKASILQYAIQGKLVEQRPEEGTGEELYRQIQAEKQRLIKEGKIKKEKTLPEITEDEIPFDIPENWKWVKLGELCSILTGKKDANFGSNEGKYFFFTCAKLPIRCDSFSFSGEAILMAGNGDIGNLSYYCGDFEAYQRTYVLQPYIKFSYLKYILYHLLSNWVSYNNDKMYGTAIPYIRLGNVQNYLVALPPLSEQHRIVAKIEELLPYVDRYAAAYEKLEQFNAKFPEDMKKSILQYAIQGKLVEQRPEEGTGEELYQQIQAEKQRLIKEGKIKKEKPLPEITEDEIPFDIPETWKWVKLGAVIDMLSGFAFKSTDFKESGRYRLLRGINLSVGNTRWDDIVYVDEVTDKLNAYRLLKGDVLIGLDRPWISEGIRVAIYDETEDTYLVQRVLRIRETTAITKEYIALLLRSNLFKNAVEGQTTGISVPHISPGQVGNVAIPLPPLAEQKRIVAKLKEILPLCERLK